MILIINYLLIDYNFKSNKKISKDRCIFNNKNTTISRNYIFFLYKG